MLVSLSELLYIDPAATSVLITSITSICVALGATAIIVWRKLKKNVKKVLKVDENAGKKVEDDLVVYDENGNVENAENNESQSAQPEATTLETQTNEDMSETQTNEDKKD